MGEYGGLLQGGKGGLRGEFQPPKSSDLGAASRSMHLTALLVWGADSDSRPVRTTRVPNFHPSGRKDVAVLPVSTTPWSDNGAYAATAIRHIA